MAIKFTLEETFDAKPDEVTAAMTDIDHYEDWMPNFVRVEKVTEGEVGVGTRWRETRKMFGREATEEFELVAYQPGERIELHVDGSKGSSKKGEFHFVYRLREKDGKTRMRMDGSIDGMGFIFSLLGKLFAGPFKKAVARDHEALRDYIASKKARA